MGIRDGGRGKGPSRPVAAPGPGGAIAAVGVSSWVPKEEKLSWRTDASRASFSLSLSLSLSLFLSLLLSSSAFLAEGETKNSFKRASEEDGGRLKRVRSSLVEGSSSRSHLSFRRRKL